MISISDPLNTIVDLRAAGTNYFHVCMHFLACPLWTYTLPASRAFWVLHLRLIDLLRIKGAAVW